METKRIPGPLGRVAEANMRQSFGIVEDKLREADFFLRCLGACSRFDFDARCYFSAFVSASRSITLALQATMARVDGFATWYKDAQGQLKVDPLAPFFVEIRNDVVHTGRNPLDQVTLDHLREDLYRQMHHYRHSHILVLPDPSSHDSTTLVDAVQACTAYLISLVGLVFACYERFKSVVDPRWYFTRDNFSAMGRTFKDAVAELGFPPPWAACAPEAEGGWRVLRLQQPACQINDLFRKYIGREIPDPDSISGK